MTPNLEHASRPGTVRRHAAARPLLFIAGLAALVTLTGCNTDYRVVSKEPAPDYRRIHPIVLVQGDANLDIFVNGKGGTIGNRQYEDLQAFAADHRRYGQGPITISVPTGVYGAREAAGAIRQSLGQAGIRTITTSYVPAQAGTPAPVRLSYPKLEADVATKCGRWPSDLSGYGGTVEGWENKPYENFGCASQGYLAAQVADPLDLVRSQPLTPGFGARQADVVTRYGKGKPTQAETAATTQTVSSAVAQ